MTISGNNYCLGYGLSDKCASCQHGKNWVELNEMPQSWRKNAQSSMKRIDESECGPYGCILYSPSSDRCPSHESEQDEEWVPEKSLDRMLDLANQMNDILDRRNRNQQTEGE